MNKKVFLGLFATSAIMFGTACSSEDLIEQGGDNTATVSFTLSTEDAAQSRNISDGTTAKKLYYAVYDEENEKKLLGTISKKDGVTCTDLLTGHAIDLKLLKGQTYTIAFWAQAEDSPYTTDIDNGKFFVNMDYSTTNEVTINNDNRDGFFQTKSFTVDGDQSYDVVLQRPFAQINVGTTDYDDAKNLGFTVVKSKAVFNNIGTSLNVLTGSCFSYSDVTFSYSSIPTEKLNVDGIEYTWLCKCYVLPNTYLQGNRTTIDAEFCFTNENETKVERLSDGLDNMPIQSTFRTNILGQFLTDNSNFVVVIENQFNAPDHKPLGDYAPR